jgi:predicted DNA-binding protein
MKEITVRLPCEYQRRLKLLAAKSGMKPAVFAREKLLEAIEAEERIRHDAEMKEMVRQAIAFNEVRDILLEGKSLEAIARMPH